MLPWLRSTDFQNYLLQLYVTYEERSNGGRSFSVSVSIATLSIIEGCLLPTQPHESHSIAHHLYDWMNAIGCRHC